MFISHNSLDLPNLQKVAVIASFNPEGKIAPLYVKIGEESYKIIQYWEKSPEYECLVFQCDIVDNNIKKSLQLTYHPKDFIWSIPNFR